MFTKMFGLVFLITVTQCVQESSGRQTKRESAPQTLLALNECFRYVPDLRLKIAAEHVGGTESIQFKDDCLRACMRSLIQQVFTCRSLMHIPTDDDCLLTTTDMNHTEYERTKDFPPTNYYENQCSLSPYGEGTTITEARFNGYKGGEGIIRFAQKYGEPTKALLILDGLQENTRFQIRHYTASAENCYKLQREDVARSKQLLEVETDPNGMAIVPWNNVELDRPYENFLETLVLVVDEYQIVVDCGRVKPALNNSHSSHSALKSSNSANRFRNPHLVGLITMVIGFIMSQF